MSDLFVPDAEVAVLSIIMNNPDLIYSSSGLKPFMFSSRQHEILYMLIEDLKSRNLVPDYTMIFSSLSTDKKLDMVGGSEYLNYIKNQEYPKQNIQEFINLVIDSYKARTVLSVTSAITKDKLDTIGVNSVITSLKQKLDDLVEVSGGNHTSAIGDNIFDVVKEIESRTTNPGVRGTTWGFKKVDIVSGGKCPGDVWFLAGRPGSGKTALVCNSVLTDGKNGEPVLFFSREMNHSSIVERILAIDTQIPIVNIRLGILKKEEIEKIKESAQRLKNLPIYIDTSFNTDMLYIESTIRKFVSTHNIKGVYVDYIQLLTNREDNQTAELGRISRKFRLLANELNLYFIVLSQLNREVEHRENKRPVMSDLRQSGNLEEDADYVVGLYREAYYNPKTEDKKALEFIILKSRNGPVGTIALSFNAETNVVSGDV